MRGWYEENQSNLDESQFVNLSSGGGGGFGGGAGSSFDYDGNIGICLLAYTIHTYSYKIIQLCFYSSNYSFVN